MKRRTLKKNQPVWMPVLLCLVCAFVGYQLHVASTPIAPLLFGGGILWLLLTGELERLWNLPSLCLLGYVGFTMLTMFWAISGKFFLQEYSKLFIAAFFFLFAVLRIRGDGHKMRRATSIIAGMTALYAALSVEGASTGGIRALIALSPDWTAERIMYDRRLLGVFANPNIESSLYAIGIIFSVALLCSAENKKERVLWAVSLAANAYAFVLVISLGATACFGVAVIVYLIFAGRGRGAALLRMLEGALPALLCAFPASYFFNSPGKKALPVLLLLLAAGAAAALELLLAEKLSAVLAERAKLLLIAPLAIAGLGLAYLLVAVNFCGPYTFGDPITRGAALAPGVHTMRLDADETVGFNVYSRSRQQIMISSGEYLTVTPVGDGSFSFVVPEHSEICDVTVFGEAGQTVRSAVLDEQTPLKLKYRLLPAFVANRLQSSLRSNSSVILRAVLAEDGLKLFRLSPIVGNGMGAYEAGIAFVQEFHFESKYVHQHYVQVLLESGVIGFLPYIVALLALAVALWKGRLKEKDGFLVWFYPAMCAEFVMSSLQMLWDVSMSVCVFLCFTYTLYGMIVGAFVAPLPAPAAGNAGKKRPGLPVRLACAALPAFFMVALFGNLYARLLCAQHFESYDQFYTTYDRAASIDLFERHDTILTYVLETLDKPDGALHREQADAYAAELMGIKSNSAPYFLIRYYLGTGQYEKAIEAAELCAVYSASDPNMWNASIALLKQALIDTRGNSPLLTDGGVLLGRLMEYYGMLEQRNATAVEPIALNAGSQAFFEKVLAMNACGGDIEAMYNVLA